MTICVLYKNKHVVKGLGHVNGHDRHILFLVPAYKTYGCTSPVYKEYLLTYYKVWLLGHVNEHARHMLSIFIHLLLAKTPKKRGRNFGLESVIINRVHQ
jgi:hypothetical protein